MIGMELQNGSLCMLSDETSRSISPENLTGEKGGGARAKIGEGIASDKAAKLGEGWKVNPFVRAEPGQTLVLADIRESGCIRQMWFTPTGDWRSLILRIYWDNSPVPSVECPIGDFFGCGWGKFCQISSLAVCVNPGSGFNCYWPMPFRSRALITIENRDDYPTNIYYQINYSIMETPENAAYFHAQFRRVNPQPYKEVYTIANGITGKGHYVGTALFWGANTNLWWGEGEIKFYLDGDTEYPTICGTGTEDYFGGSYDFMNRETHEYQEFTTPYSGLPQVIRPRGGYESQQRFSMYRWHITDPIHFKEDLRVTIQALGWRTDRGYLPLQDDIASVAFWYQQKPAEHMPPLPDAEYLRIH